MNIPTQKEWGEIPDEYLDEKCAYDHFFGKSLKEAESLFKEHALYYQEDLYYMESVPFQFYSQSFINYITSEKSKGDSDGASSFINLVFHKIEEDPKTWDFNWSKVKKALDFIYTRQQWFDADKYIYGLFSKRIKEIYKLMSEHKKD